jgi:hypothetical protein
MWGLLIILAGDPLHRVSWYTTQEACHRQAEVEVLHAATTRREVTHIECRSYVLPATRATGRVEVLR